MGKDKPELYRHLVEQAKRYALLGKLKGDTFDRTAEGYHRAARKVMALMTRFSPR